MQKEDAYTLDDLLEKAKVYIKSDEDIELIKKAYLFASKAHAGQLRLTGDDYMLHPLNVALILTEIYADAQTLSAALLHDVINFANVTIEEIEKELNVPKEDIIISMDAIQEPISLQEPVYGDNTDNIYVMDQISDKKNTDEHWADSLTISSAIQKLNDKEKMIINKRFFEGRTQMEVADEIGISQAQVSRLEKNAIDHIKRIYKQN